MVWLILVFLLVALMVFLYGYSAKDKPEKLPKEHLLPGYDFSKGSPWKSASMTKGSGKNLSEAVGESRDRDAPKKTLLPPPEDGAEKTDKRTIVLGESRDRDAPKKTLLLPPEDGAKKPIKRTILVEDDSPEN